MYPLGCSIFPVIVANEGLGWDSQALKRIRILASFATITVMAGQPTPP